MNDYATPKKRYDGSKVEVKWRLKNWDHFKPATARRTLYLFNRVERPNHIPVATRWCRLPLARWSFPSAPAPMQRSVTVMVLDPAIHNAFYDTQNAEELPVIVTMDLLPIDIVAVLAMAAKLAKQNSRPTFRCSFNPEGGQSLFSERQGQEWCRQELRSPRGRHAGRATARIVHSWMHSSLRWSFQ